MKFLPFNSLLISNFNICRCKYSKLVCRGVVKPVLKGNGNQGVWLLLQLMSYIIANSSSCFAQYITFSFSVCITSSAFWWSFHHCSGCFHGLLGNCTECDPVVTALHVLVTGRDSQYCMRVTVLLFTVMLLTCLILCCYYSVFRFDLHGWFAVSS